MRIGIDCRLWNETGVGRYIRNLVSRLNKIDKKNEYVLFVLQKDKERIRNYESGVSWRLVIADIRWHSLAEQIKFPAILNKEDLDLVHFPYFSVPIFYNRPFVVTIHDLILHHFPTGEASTLPSPVYWLKLAGYKYVIQKGALKAEKIITVSNATKKEIVDHLKIPQEKVVVAYEGIDDEIRNTKGKIRNKSQHKKFFLYVGNAYPHKNLKRLLLAFEKLLVEFPDVQLILVGKKDYFYQRLEEVRQEKLEQSVVFFGEATDENLSYLYRNALAFISPSLMEGFGLTVLEAMSNSCLVLESDIDAFKEISGNSAIYFNPLSEKDIGEKMKLVCSNDLKHFNKNIQAGLERAAMFSWEKMARETIAVYESCFGV